MQTSKTLLPILNLSLAVCLFFSQYFSGRQTIFTDNIFLIVIGVVVATGGILLLIKSSKHMKLANNTKSLCTDGPYAYIRHPIYTGIFVMSVGMGLIFFSVWWFVVLVTFVPLYYLISKLEEKDLIKIYKKKYINYMKKTGMFFPKMK